MRIVRLLLMFCACPAFLCAQEPAAPTDRTAVQIVTYLDLLPAQADPGRALLVRQVQAQQTFPGCLSARLVQEEGRANHFMLVESWRDAAVLDTCRATREYLQFRRDSPPARASPLDERRGRQIVP